MSGPIKKFPGPIHDSLGKCDNPSMLYDTIRNPNAPYVRPQVSLDSKDTLESTQQRLNREIFERFRNSGLNLSHESFIAVAQVGKYMFLAIMVPPYLLFYGVPRWLLLNVMPHIFHFMKNESIRIGRYIQEIANKIPDIMKGALEQLLGEALKIAKQMAKGAGIHIHAGAQAVLKLLVQPFVSLKELIINCKLSSKRASNRMFAKLVKLIDDSREKLKKSMKKAILKVGEGVINLLRSFDKAVFTPAVNWIISPFIKAANKTIASYRKVVSATRVLNKKLQKMVKPVVTIAEKASELTMHTIKLIAQHTVQPVINWMMLKLQTANEASKRFRKSLSDLGKNVKGIGENTSSGLMHYVKIAFQAIPTTLLQGIRWMRMLIPQVTRKILNGRKGYPQNFGRMIKKSVNTAIEGTSKAFKAIAKAGIKGISWIINVLWKFFKWLKEQLLALPHKLKAISIKLTHFISKFFTTIIYSFRLAVASAWALIVIGLLTIREFLETEDWTA